MARRRHRSTRRSLVLLAAVTVPFVLLALALPFFIPENQLLLPQAREEFAPRRDAPENAARMLQEAYALLEEANVEMAFRPDANVMSGLLQQPGMLEAIPGPALLADFPPQDLDVDAYLKQSRPAVAKAREAAGAPWYLTPQQAALMDLRAPNNVPGFPRPVLSHLLAHAVLAPPEEGAAVLRDALRLARLMREDGVSGMRVETEVMKTLIAVARHGDPAQLDRLEALLDEVGPPPVSMRPVVEDYLRAIDETALNPRGRGGNPFYRTVETWYFQKSVARLAEDLDEMLEQAETHPSELYDRSARRMGHRYQGLGWSLRGLCGEYVELMSAWPAARIVLALERCRAAEGAYPKDLDHLVPSHLDAIPEDPGSRAPYVYMLAGDQYRLYGLGLDGTDDGGNPRRDCVWVTPIMNMAMPPMPGMPGMPTLPGAPLMPPVPGMVSQPPAP